MVDICLLCGGNEFGPIKFIPREFGNLRVRSASLALTDFFQVDLLGVRYTSVFFGAGDRLRVGWLNGFDTLGGVPREQKMLKGHPPRVICLTKYTSVRKKEPGLTE